MRQRIILVTGGTSGIGREVVEALAAGPHRVYAASRRPGALPSGARWLPMDVRDPDSIRQALETLMAESGRLDVVVANAGVMLGGLLEETERELARAVFETNFWGVVELNAQALPVMRRQGRGQLVVVGSLAGRVGTPGHGFYSAAKFALAGYAEALAAEVQGFGIRVHLVEPGYRRTALGTHMQRGGLRFADYDPIREEVARRTLEHLEGGDDPRNVARRVQRLVTHPPATLRHPVGRDARWVPRIKNLVPEPMFRRVVRRKFGLVPAAGGD